MSGTLTQAPGRGTSHRAATTSFSDHLTHLPQAPRRTTPNLLRAAVAATGVLAAVAAIVLTGAADGARSRVSAVGSTDAPSVRAANDFLYQLQDMDAQLVNALLVNGDTSVHVPRATSESLYDRDRQAANADLQLATVALAGNPDALRELHDVTDTFGLYQAQAARTLADDEREGGDVAGTTTPAVLANYLKNDSLLFGSDGKSGLMAAAKALEQSSKDAIDSSAGSANGSLNALIAEFLVSGALLVAGLVVLQVFLVRRFQRLVNPALIGATVVALVIMIGGAVGAAGAKDDFHTAKSDAFDSVLALGEADALSAGMNSDESRWLLVHDEPAQRDQFEASYVQGAEQVAKVSPVAGALDYNSSLVAARDQILEARASGDLSADSLAATKLTADSAFGREFRNITFEGEADAAASTFVDYTAYVLDDTTLRQMALNPPVQWKTAIDFDTDADTPGSSDKAFAAYSHALGDLIALNESHFEAALPAAKNGIGTWTWLPYLLAVSLIGLTVLGLRPRFNEYR